MKPEKSRGDQTVEIILATTALVTVIALFLRSAPSPAAVNVNVDLKVSTKSDVFTILI